jgi:hypothetical protein
MNIQKFADFCTLGVANRVPVCVLCDRSCLCYYISEFNRQFKKYTLQQQSYFQVYSLMEPKMISELRVYLMLLLFLQRKGAMQYSPTAVVCLLICYAVISS